jgi:hypothetical protein
MQLLLAFARGCSLNDDARWLPLLQRAASVAAITPSLFFKFLPPWRKNDGRKTSTPALPGAGSLRHQTQSARCLHIDTVAQLGVPCQTSPNTATRGAETTRADTTDIVEFDRWIDSYFKGLYFSKEPVMAKMFEQCKVDKAARLSFDTFLQVG